MAVEVKRHELSCGGHASEAGGGDRGDEVGGGEVWRRGRVNVGRRQS